MCVNFFYTLCYYLLLLVFQIKYTHLKLFLSNLAFHLKSNVQCFKKINSSSKKAANNNKSLDVDALK